MSLELRAGTDADTPEVARMMSEAFAGYRVFAPATWVPPTEGLEQERLAGLLGNPAVWSRLAFDGDRLVGHAIAHAATIGRRPSDEPGLAHLRNLFIDPSQWGTGLATALHAAALAAMRAAGMTRIRLVTPAGQARARRFYEREGWRGGTPFEDEAFGMALVEYRRELSH